MNDPHVVALIYSIEYDDSVNYSKAPILNHEEERFRVAISENQVRFEFKETEHYATVETALKAVEEIIRCWEFDASLRGRPGQFKLRFVQPVVIDRSPPPSEPGKLRLSGPLWVNAPTGRVTLKVSNPIDYPAPPFGLNINLDDPDVRAMMHRFERYCLNREPLPGMAYFCLTVLGRNSGGRGQVAVKYSIGLSVLREIGRLTGKKGGGTTARKAVGIDDDLTSQEICFLEEVVKAMIRRVAEVAYDPDGHFPKIGLEDLPQLQ